MGQRGMHSQTSWMRCPYLPLPPGSLPNGQHIASYASITSTSAANSASSGESSVQPSSASAQSSFVERRCLVPGHRSATQWRCEAGELTQVCHQGRRSPTAICFLGYLAERQGPGEEGRIECRHRDLRLLADHSYPLVETINHERMPVLLAREEGFETWLTGPPDEAFSLAQQSPPDRMKIVQE